MKYRKATLRISLCVTTCLLPLTAIADYPSVVLDSDPIGYWRMNEQSLETAFNSGTAGDSLNGVYRGGEVGVSGPSRLPDGRDLLAMGIPNNAYAIGGVDSFLDVDASPLSSLDQFTMSGWILPNQRSGNRIGLWGQNDAIEFGFIEPNRLQVWTPGGGSLNWDFDPNLDLETRQWYHLAAVGTGTELQLYVNGELEMTGGSAVDGVYGESDFGFRVGGGGIFDATGNQYSGSVDEVAIWDRALTADEVRRQFQSSIGGGIPGDFNFDGNIDLADVNLLLAALDNNSNDTLFDLDLNGFIDDDDLSIWVRDLRITWVGDANLDGEFNSSDFVSVFQKGEYEDGIENNSGWEDGDWNGDREFSSADFVSAFQDGGFEVGPNAVASVPEPSSLLLLLVALPVLLRQIRLSEI